MPVLWLPFVVLVSSGAQPPVTYHRDVAGVFHRRCLTCHRPGQVAPFALTNYQQAAPWAETIAEVVRDGRMPPWHADSRYGRFANDCRLSEPEKKLILNWVAAGAPEGNPAEAPPLAPFSEGSTFPEPDLVVAMPQVFTVPAQGVVEYQTFVVDPGFRKDRWVSAAEVRPGNRKVVHHCSIFLRPPGHDGPVAQGALGSYCLTTGAPGTPPLRLPEGMAKKIPAGWHIEFVMHYTTVGTVETDQTRLALVFADPKTVRQEVATMLLHDLELSIPPGVRDHRIEKTWVPEQDVLLLALFPHMHLRGRSFRYEADYPDGSREILLDVPRYDFGWQNMYYLAEPKRIPAGTSLRCIARYDNSSDNPANPDPKATVLAGTQTWEEMFNGYFEWALADQDLTRPPTFGERLDQVRKALPRTAIGLLVVPLGGAFLLVNRRRRRSGP